MQPIVTDGVVWSVRQSVTIVSTAKKPLNRPTCRLGSTRASPRKNYYRDARWRNLANTTEPSLCGGDAALRQITLSTCWLLFCRLLKIAENAGVENERANVRVEKCRFVDSEK